MNAALPEAAAREIVADRGDAWMRLWLSTRPSAWVTLAIVPVGGASSIAVARALAAVGRRHLGTPVEVLDGTELDLGALEAHIADLARRKDPARRALVAVAAVADSPVAAAIARAASAALLCVCTGDRIAAADETIDAIGADRFAGAVITVAGRTTK